MRKWCVFMVLGVAGVLAMLSLGAVHAKGCGGTWTWEITPLPVDAAWTFSNPIGVNEKEWVVGFGGADLGSRRPLLWRDGGYEDLLLTCAGTASYDRGTARAINRCGLIAGEINQPGGPNHAVVWDVQREEAYVAHPAPGDVPDFAFTASHMFSLNDKGIGVGFLQNVTSAGFEGERAYRWNRRGRPGELLPVPDGYSSRAYDINNHGIIVGNIFPTDTPSEIRATIWIPKRGKVGGYELIDIHADLTAEFPDIARSTHTTVDDFGRVFGYGLPGTFPPRTWSWMWTRCCGIEFLDVDGSLGVAEGGTGRFQGGWRGSLIAGDTDALFWRCGEPEVLPRLPGYDGHSSEAVNRRGVVVGLAIRQGNTFWWQGSDPWIARRTYTRK